MKAKEPLPDPALTAVELGKFALRPPEITILSDHAARGSLNLSDSPDQLELRSRLAGIYDILRHRHTRCPVAIGIYGDWGSGKTSAMRWLETRLKEWNRLTDPARTESGATSGTFPHPCVHPVWFDPWKYHTREEVWRGIIAEVILAMLKRPTFTGPGKLAALKFAARRFTTFLGHSFLTALSHISIKAGNGDAGAELSGEVFSDLYKEWKDYRQPEKAFLNEFEDALRSFIRQCIPPTEKGDHTYYPERICLFIDDLDRCLPDVTLEVLEALKLYLNIPALVFVVGLDQHVVQAVVSQHYEKHGVHRMKARDYLGKIFQVELPIAPSAFQMEGFLAGQLATLDTITGHYWTRSLPGEHKERVEKALTVLTKHNPREIKRLLNSSLLFARALSEDPTLVTEGDTTAKQDTFASALAFFLIRRLIQLRFPLIEGRFETDKDEHLWLEKASVIRQDQGWTLDRLRDVIHGPRNLEDIELDYISSRGSSSDKMTKQAIIEQCQPRPGTWETLWVAHYAARPTDEKGPLDSPFFTDPLLWELLAIPFRASLAQRAPATPESRPAAPAFDLAALPPKVQEALLAATGQTRDSFDPARLSDIKELKLLNAGLTDAHLPLLARCTALEHLELDDNPITHAGLFHLQRLPLRRLGLLRTQIADASPLTAFKQLESLSLYGCTGLRTVDHLPPSLTGLILNDCTGLTTVDDLPPSLTGLDLTGCTGLTTVEHLPPSLTGLSLDGCTGLSAVAVQKLKASRKWEYFAGTEGNR